MTTLSLTFFFSRFLLVHSFSFQERFHQPHIYHTLKSGFLAVPLWPVRPLIDKGHLTHLPTSCPLLLRRAFLVSAVLPWHILPSVFDLLNFCPPWTGTGVCLPQLCHCLQLCLHCWVRLPLNWFLKLPPFVTDLVAVHSYLCIQRNVKGHSSLCTLALPCFTLCSAHLFFLWAVALHDHVELSKYFGCTDFCTLYLKAYIAMIQNCQLVVHPHVSFCLMVIAFWWF